MTTTPVHSITDEQIAEIEDDGCYATAAEFKAIIARLRKAEKDAARWDMLVKIYDHVLTHPDSRTHDAEYGRYKAAIEAGLGITGAIDAAMAGGE